MRGMLVLLFLLSIFLVSCATNRDDTVLYLCDDGQTLLLTGDASRKCPVYEPQAEVITVPDGSSWADVEWAIGLKLAERPSPAQQRARQRVERVRTDPCAWPDLSLQRHVTVGMAPQEDVKKWESLSRVAADTGLCEEYRTKKLTPSF